jgi:hypothetical protein
MYLMCCSAILGQLCFWVFFIVGIWRLCWYFYDFSLMGVVLEGLYVIGLGKIINLGCVKFGYLGICLCVCVNKI